MTKVGVSQVVRNFTVGDIQRLLEQQITFSCVLDSQLEIQVLKCLSHQLRRSPRLSFLNKNGAEAKIQEIISLMAKTPLNEKFVIVSNLKPFDIWLLLNMQDTISPQTMLHLFEKGSVQYQNPVSTFLGMVLFQNHGLVKSQLSSWMVRHDGAYQD